MLYVESLNAYVPRPRCALCKKGVYYIEVVHNIEKHQVILIVMCHGNSEKYFINEIDFIGVPKNANEINIMEVFKPKITYHEQINEIKKLEI